MDMFKDATVLAKSEASNVPPLLVKARPCASFIESGPPQAAPVHSNRGNPTDGEIDLLPRVLLSRPSFTAIRHVD